MKLRSGNKRKRLSPPKLRKVNKAQRQKSPQRYPVPNLSLSFLNSSESLHSFSMEEQEEAVGGEAPPYIPVPPGLDNFTNNNGQSSSLWLERTIQNAPGLEHFNSNDVNRIIGDPRRNHNTSGQPRLSLDSRRTPTSNNLSSNATPHSNIYSANNQHGILPSHHSQPASGSQRSSLKLPTSQNAVTAGSNTHYSTTAQGPVGATSIAWAPTTESNTDTLLRTLISKIDVGFVNLNANLSSQFMTSMAEGIPRQPPHPNEQDNQYYQSQRNANMQENSNPQSDNISRLENIVGHLASQIQDLTSKFNALSTDRNAYEPPPTGQRERYENSGIPTHDHQPRSGPRTFYYPPHAPSYLTWLRNWNVKYDGNNKKVPVEFFVDQVESLKEVYDVTWQEVTSGFHLLVVDDALRWFLRYRKTNREILWSTLRQDLMAEFRGTDTDESIWCEIMKRKQEDGETFDKFYNSILNLHDRLINPLSDAQMIRILKDNINFEIKKCLISVVPLTLNEFVNQCRQADKLVFRDKNKRYPNYSKKVSELDSQNCYEETNYDIEAFSNKRPQTSQSLASTKCWNCDKIGHSYHSCEEPRKMFCYWCGFKNVTCKNCQRCQNFRALGNNKEPPPPSAPPLEDP